MDKIYFEEKIKKEFAEKINYKLTDEQVEKFYLFVDFLLKENEKYNLTAIKNIDMVIIKHLVDSVVIKKFDNLDKIFNEKKIIDIGTGAGFPSIPLAILYEDNEFMLIDSLNKRITFINYVAQIIKLNNIKTMHIRAEDLGRDKNYREKYDIAVSRAVADTSVLVEYMAPLIKTNGNILLYKLFDIEEEMNNAKNIINELNLKKENTNEYILLDEEPKRAIYNFKKLKPTSMVYPRPMSKIKKSIKCSNN